jgi:integrase
LSRSTVNHDLATVRHGFRLAIEAGKLATGPLVKTPMPKNARQGFFEEKPLRAVLAALPAWARAPITMMALTGWRSASEVLPLTWRQVDWKAQTVRLDTSKNDEPREFPFGTYPALKALLERQLAAGAPHDCPQVFIRDGAAIPYKRLRQAWRAACRAVPGARGKLMHDLRRTCVRNLERAGVSRSVAMSLTGHKTEAVYRRYAIVDSSAQREGVAKLAALQPSTST